MSISNRKLLLILSVMVLISVCAGCTQGATEPVETEAVEATEAEQEVEEVVETEVETEVEQEPIKIGVITEITGTSASAGKGAQEGIGFYIDEINANGGILGREVVVYFEDDTSTQTGAVNAFNKLVLEDEVDVVLGPLYSTHCLAIKPRAEELEFPWLAMGLNDRIGYEDDPVWTFQGRTTDSTLPLLVLDFLQEMGKTNPAIMYVGDDFGIDGRDKFIAEIGERGMTVATEEALQSGDKDFTAQILSIKNSGADSIIGWLHQDEAGLVLRQLKEQGVDITEIPFIGNSSFIAAGVVDVAGDAAIGAYTISGTEPALQNPEWTANFEAEYGYSPDFLAADPVDGIATILQAIVLGGGTDPESIRQGFLSMKDWVGPFGFTHTFGSEDRPQQGVFSSLIVVFNEDLKLDFVSQVER